MQLIVLGMHRSGTSVLTHLLARMGCHVGPPESLQPGDAGNPQGYWESRAAWALDEGVLAALGASWWEVADLDLAALAPADRERFTARAQAIVGELDTQRPWALKEPRLCVLLPLWRPVLDAPAFVLVHRDPLEVARSLQARDGFPLAVGVALWEVYALAALRHSLGAPRLAVSYRRLLNDPAAVASDLAAQLSPLAPGALQVPSAAELADVVRAELYRQHAAEGEAAGYLTVAQQRLAAACEDGSALAWSEVPLPSPGALELLRWFAGAERERLALPDLHHRVETAEAEAAWRRDRDADLVRWNTDLRAGITAAEAAVGAAEPEIERLQQRIAEVSRYNEELAPRLAAAEAELGLLRERDADISRHNEELVPRLAAAEEELGRLRQRDADISRHNEELVPRLAAAEEELGRLRQRDAEISRHNEELVPRLAAAEEELGRLRERDAEISQWNEALTAQIAGGEAAAAALGCELDDLREAVERLQAEHASRSREASRLRAALRRTEASLGETYEHFADLHQLLRDTVWYSERCWELSAALDRLVEDVLASRSWRAGQTLTLPLRWRRQRGPTARYRHEEVRADAEALAEQRREVARRAAHWSGGLPPLTPAEETDE
ncbi:MAG TPA: sulfotransferase [Thermoanaerobaculia bacterium]|nr:sulfotransferase [Thermoanaerobaculia bacterium]